MKFTRYEDSTFSFAARLMRITCEEKIFLNRQFNNFPSVKQANSNFFWLLATIDILQSFKANIQRMKNIPQHQTAL